MAPDSSPKAKKGRWRSAVTRSRERMLAQTPRRLRPSPAERRSHVFRYTREIYECPVCTRRAEKPLIHRRILSSPPAALRGAKAQRCGRAHDSDVILDSSLKVCSTKPRLERVFPCDGIFLITTGFVVDQFERTPTLCRYHPTFEMVAVSLLEIVSVPDVQFSVLPTSQDVDIVHRASISELPQVLPRMTRRISRSASRALRDSRWSALDFERARPTSILIRPARVYRRIGTSVNPSPARLPSSR